MTLELAQLPAVRLENGRRLMDGHLSNGAVQPAQRVSSYLQYLPGAYQLDEFTGRFLLIFESVLGPIEQMIDTLASYFDPRLAPREMLAWLASWVGIELDENWPLERQRLLVLWAVTLYRLRGTRRGLREHLRLYTGRTPHIVENFDGMRVGQDAALGVSTLVGSEAPRPHSIRVTVFADEPSSLDERVVRQIIEFQKPAQVGYTFEIRAAGGEAL
jgi:phage tail-like protein